MCFNSLKRVGVWTVGIRLAAIIGHSAWFFPTQNFTQPFAAPSVCIVASDDAQISALAQVRTSRLRDRSVAACGSDPPCRCSLQAESSDRASRAETDSCFHRSAGGHSDRGAVARIDCKLLLMHPFGH